MEEEKLKKHCFLCATAKYVLVFALGVLVGLVWGSL